jgi:hypothetical protein
VLVCAGCDSDCHDYFESFDVSEDDWEMYLSLDEQEAFELCRSWCSTSTSVTNMDTCQSSTDEVDEEGMVSFFCSGPEDCK